MAALNSRVAFKDYCMRRLGYPVVDINIDDEQIEERIDDALQKFRDYHFDGTEHAFYKIRVTATDIANQYVSVPEEFTGITRIFRISAYPNVSNLFNVRYQMHLNDLFNYTAANYAPYVMAMRHIETLEEIFVGDQPIRFNRHQNILNIDMDWSGVAEGTWIVAEGYKVVDPDQYTSVWDDPWLKKYATALIKQQWGANLKVFEGMQLPGGVTFNGQRIWDEANQEIDTLDHEVINSYSLPVTDMMG